MTQPLALSERHRPATLDAILGQSFAVMSLTDFADFPFPQAFLFSGASGVGKTTAGLALANALGVNRDWNLILIRSGEMDAEAVEKALSTVRAIGIKNGWKLILCDEADKMSAKSSSLWLSALEDVQAYEYGKTVIVFTTNKLSKFETRFRDRCELIEFESDPKTLYNDAESLLADIWWQEGLPGIPPRLDSIKGIVEDGELSFRRVIRFVEQQSRRPRSASQLAELRKEKIQSAKPVQARSSVLL